MLLLFTHAQPEVFTRNYQIENELIPPFCRIVSRLRYRPDYFNCLLASEPIEAILAQTAANLTFAECCDQRALQLEKQNRSRYLISYSGGIDSTCLIVSILKNWSKDNIKKIEVIMSHSSIEENPLFVKKYLCHFPMHSSFLQFDRHFFSDNPLLITGELGDQIFGSDLLGLGCQAFGDEILNKPYSETGPRIINLVTQNEYLAKKIFNRLEPIVHECPFPIQTAHDFFWWYNFTQKWQIDKYKYLAYSNWDLSLLPHSFVQHFFDSPEFQRWSLYNHDKKIKKTWASYKFSAKEYIYDFTRNESDLNLQKQQSFKKTFFLTKCRMAIRTDYTACQDMSELFDSYIKSY